MTNNIISSDTINRFWYTSMWLYVLTVAIQSVDDNEEKARVVLVFKYEKG